MVKENKF